MKNEGIKENGKKKMTINKKIIMAKKDETALKELHKAVKDHYEKKGRPMDPVIEEIIKIIETLIK